MIRNYVTLAIRNLVKRKLYSFINAFGLSCAIAFSILICLYIHDENSFDQFHKNKDDVFMLTEMHLDPASHAKGEDNPYRYSSSLPAMFAEVLKQEAPEVKHVTRFGGGQGIMRYNDNISKQPAHYVDSGFFKMFSFDVLKGSVNRIFENPHEAVLTEKLAKKYFGNEDPVGKLFTFHVRETKTFVVAAVIQDPPANSSLDFEMLLSVQNRPFFEEHRKHWGFLSYTTFVQLYPEALLSTFSVALDGIAEKYTGEETRKWRERDNLPLDVVLSDVGFTSLNALHLNTQIKWNRSSDPAYGYILSCIAVLILIIAVINYITLVLTSSASRRLEVGIRKVAGAQRKQLIHQFGLESIILASLSMVVGIAIAGVLLPLFNDFTGKSINFRSVNPAKLAAFSVGGSVIVGIFAGMYPSFFLARFRPIAVLKSRGSSKLHAGFSKPLVILQFALSAFLVISSVIMYRQLKFVTTKDLGYNKDQVLVVPTLAPGEPSDRIIAQFRNKTLGNPLIVDVTGASMRFGDASYYGYKINGQYKTACVYSVDSRYIPLLNLKLLAGRNFDERIGSDSNAVIVNEALVRDMQWKAPLDEYLNWSEDAVGPGAKVIGVLKDYNFLSLENEIGPMFLSMDKEKIGHLNNMMVKLAAGNIPLALESVQKTWKQLNPDKPFEYSFLDEDVARQYKSYTRWMKIAGLSTVFAILIASLGLFGLAGINAVNKTKEIGIRKVMGADVFNILILLNKQYVGMSFFAFALAAPFSWYVMHRWIATFQFKIRIEWEIFFICTIAGVVIAIATVSYHSIRAALINPAETLKYE